MPKIVSDLRVHLLMFLNFNKKRKEGVEILSLWRAICSTQFLREECASAGGWNCIYAMYLFWEGLMLLKPFYEGVFTFSPSLSLVSFQLDTSP